MNKLCNAADNQRSTAVRVVLVLMRDVRTSSFVEGARMPSRVQSGSRYEALNWHGPHGSMASNMSERAEDREQKLVGILPKLFVSHGGAAGYAEQRKVKR